MKSYLKTISLLLLLLVLGFAPTKGQRIVEVRQVEQDQGLAQRNIYKVVRDQYGYFYLFMKDAVQRYDGSYFTTVNFDALTSRKLNIPDISSVNLLKSGKIIIICNQADQHFVIEPRSLSIDLLPLTGNLMASEGQLYKSDGESDEYTLYKVDISDTANPSTESITELEFAPLQYIAHGGDKYFSSTDNTIYKSIDGKLKKYSTKGRLIATDQGVFVWSSNAVYQFKNHDLIPISRFPKMQLTLLKKDKAGNQVACYSASPRIQAKLFVLTPSLQLKHYDNIIGVSKYLRDIWTDDASYKWMLVGYNSIQVVNLLRDGTSIINKNPKAKKGQFGNVITGVAADKKGNIYFSKESKGIFKMITQDSAAYVHSEDVYDHTYINNERCYQSTFDDLFYSYNYRYDGKTDIIKSNLDDRTFTKKTIPFKTVDIYPMRPQTLLVGGYDEPTNIGRLGIYDFKTQQLQTVRNDIPRVRSLHYDTKEKIYWIGTISGLYVMDKNFEDITFLDNTKAEASQQFLPNDYIIMVQEYANKILVGSYGSGLYVIDKNTYQVEQTISKSQGMSDNTVAGIMPDDLGNCWLTTFNGVNVIDSSFSVIHKMYDHQGLNDREFNSKAIAKDTAGHIYAGTLNGLARFDPEKVLQYKETYGFDISDIHAFENGKSTQIDNPQDINLYAADVDSLTINVLYPDYYKFPFTEGKAQAEWDTELADVKIRKNHLTVSNLRSGDQQIHIGSDLATNKSSLQISVSKDYSSILLTLGLMLLMGLISYLIIQNNKKTEKESTELNRKLSELQLTSLQSQMNPHFIFNALGAIQYFIQTHDAEKADEYLSNFAMLMRRILESSKSKYISLKNEIDLLQLYVGLEGIRFENKFEYNIKLDDDLDMDINVPPMIIQPYIENAINHGIYNLTERLGVLNIEFVQVDEDTVQCIVTDNGVGRKKAQELRTKRHKSRGMEIVKERVETINTAQDLNVTIAVSDILSNKAVIGTKAIITIKEFQ